MAAGSNTFIDQMMKICGFQNLITHHRYPQISPAEIINLNPKFILLSSEPFPFSDKHRSEIAAAFPEARVVLVNGEMFSWYGSRMLQAANYFRQLQKMLF